MPKDKWLLFCVPCRWSMPSHSIQFGHVIVTSSSSCRHTVGAAVAIISSSSNASSPSSSPAPEMLPPIIIVTSSSSCLHTAGAAVAIVSSSSNASPPTHHPSNQLVGRLLENYKWVTSYIYFKCNQSPSHLTIFLSYSYPFTSTEYNLSISQIPLSTIFTLPRSRETLFYEIEISIWTIIHGVIIVIYVHIFIFRQEFAIRAVQLTSAGSFLSRCFLLLRLLPCTTARSWMKIILAIIQCSLSVRSVFASVRSVFAAEFIPANANSQIISDAMIDCCIGIAHE